MKQKEVVAQLSRRREGSMERHSVGESGQYNEKSDERVNGGIETQRDAQRKDGVTIFEASI